MKKKFIKALIKGLRMSNLERADRYRKELLDKGAEYEDAVLIAASKFNVDPNELRRQKEIPE